jgi:hypothetical protein
MPGRDEHLFKCPSMNSLWCISQVLLAVYGTNSISQDQDTNYLLRICFTATMQVVINEVSYLGLCVKALDAPVK